jgi:hypothetical protein
VQQEGAIGSCGHTPQRRHGSVQAVAFADKHKDSPWLGWSRWKNHRPAQLHRRCAQRIDEGLARRLSCFRVCGARGGSGSSTRPSRRRPPRIEHNRSFSGLALAGK